MKETAEVSPYARESRRIALRVAFLYCVIGTLWILLSDAILETLLPSRDILSEAQTYKGWFFILFTTGCLYVGLKQYLGRWAHESERRENAEHALRAAESQYRRIVETAEEGIWVVDADNKTEFVNQKMASILGYKVNEMLGRPLFDFMDADGVALCKHNLERRRQGIREQHEFRFRRKEGTFVWTQLTASPMFDNGDYIGSLSMVTDITDRKRSQLELQRHRDLLAAAEHQAQLGSFQLDKESGRMLCSVEMRRLLGYPPDAEVTVHSLLDRIVEDDRAKVLSNLSSDNPACSCQLRLAAENGKVRHIAFAYTARRDANGSIVSYQGIAQDITERKLTEEQLRQNHKMHAIGQLAGGIAHDFNNQLSAILGYAGMLREQLTDSKLGRFAEKICTAAERSADLTRKLLVFSHKGTSSFAPLDAHKILQETAEMLQRSIDKRIRVEMNLHAREFTVSGDASQLQSAFLNLGLNARDAMPAGGTLRFSTEVRDVRAGQFVFEGRELAPGAYLCVHVSDTGVGMTPEVQNRLFEPFFTTKPIGKGTGLGLASVYGTVRSHGGIICVESELQRGTTFTLLIPLIIRPQSQSGLKTVPRPSSARMRCILMAEDEPDLRELMQEILATRCKEVLVAKDGLQAIDLFKKRHDSVELAIVDIQMPGASGREVVESLRAINPGIRILVTSGNSECGIPNVAGFLQKPFRTQDLLNVVETLTLEDVGTSST